MRWPGCTASVHASGTLNSPAPVKGSKSTRLTPRYRSPTTPLASMYAVLPKREGEVPKLYAPSTTAENVAMPGKPALPSVMLPVIDPLKRADPPRPAAVTSAPTIDTAEPLICPV